MKIERSLPEVLSKISPKSFMELGRLVRDVKNPLKELQVFLGVKSLDPKRTVTLRSGYQIPVETLHDFQQAFWDILVRKSYSVYSSDLIILDVGANIGCFSAYALAKSPKAQIFAFEPSSSNFKRLQNLVKVNGAEARIKTFQMGVARKTGELSLNVSVDSAYHTSFGHAAKGERNEIIKVLSLKDLLALVGSNKTVDLLKLDCEGAEMDCLLGADKETLSQVKRLEVEYHEWAGFSFEELTGHLKNCGFTLHTLMANKKDQTGNASFVKS